MKKDNERWWLIKTRPNAQKKVSKMFGKLGVSHYLPLQKQIRQWHDRKKKVAIPIFGSYIFVYMKDTLRYTVFDVPGVSHFVSIAGKPVKVREEDIEQVRRICAYEDEVEIMPETGDWQPGQEVKIKAGPLMGLEGIVIDKAGKKQFLIKVEVLQAFAKVKLKANDLKAVATS